MLVAKKRLANRITGVSARATRSDEFTSTVLARRGGRMQDVAERGHGEDRGGEKRQRRDRPRARRVEPLGAVSEPSGEEGKPEDQQAVGEHGADQRRLDDTDQPFLEREQRYE